MVQKLLLESWFDQRTRLWVTCDHDSCLLEVSVKREVAGESGLVEVEILQQAKDPRGLAIGPALVVHRQRIECGAPDPHNWRSGRAWLPSRFANASIFGCYFRVHQPNAEEGA